MGHQTETNTLIPDLVSIVIPVFNGEQYLARCLDSVLNQTYDKLQVILIDDGSTDSSVKICDAYAARDPRVIVEHKENRGPSSARNSGVAKAEGVYLSFVDCDDYLESDAISSMVQAMKTQNADLVCGNYVIDEVHTGQRRVANVQNDDRNFTQKEIADALVYYLHRPGGYNMLVVAWGTLYLTHIIKDNEIAFDESVRVYEDVKFIMEYYRHVSTIHYHSAPVYNYHGVYSLTAAGTIGLARDPLAFKNPIAYILGFVRDVEGAGTLSQDVLDHILVSYAIRTIILIVKLNGRQRLQESRKLISVIMNDSEIRQALGSYKPEMKNESRAIPKLMKWKCSWLLLMVAIHKTGLFYAKR